MTDNLATQLNSPLVTLSVGAVATIQDPNNPANVDIYAGLGEANVVSTKMTPSEGATQFYGTGMIKSTDSGKTWSLLGQPGPNLPITSNYSYRATFSKIVIANANTIYAAVSVGKNGVTGNQGIWRSTDAGQSWTNVTAAFGLPSNLEYSDLAILPGTGSTTPVLYAAIGEAAGNSANGVYESTDGGTNWTLMAGSSSKPLPQGSDVGRITLAISPMADPMTGNYVLYGAFSTTPTTPNVLEIGHVDELGYVEVNGSSADTTSDWSHIVGKVAGDKDTDFVQPTDQPYDYLKNQGFYDTTLIVDPFDPSHIYAGGQDAFLDIKNAIGSKKGNAAGVIDLADGHGSIHVDHHGIALIVTGSTFTLLDGDDGGVFQFDPIADSGKGHWNDLNAAGLQIGQLYSVAANPMNPGQLYAGLQDNGNAATLDGSTVWRSASDGDGSEIFIEPSTDPKISNETVYLTNTAFLFKNRTKKDPFDANEKDLHSVFDSNDKGNGSLTKDITVDGFPGNFPAPTYKVVQINGHDYIWYAGVDSANNNVLYLSKDGGKDEKFDAIGAPGTNFGWFTTVVTASENGQTTDNTVVDSIGVSAADANFVYVGVRGGHLLVTTNGLSQTPTWTELDPVLNPGSAQVDLRYSQIWVDPNNQYIAYVVAANFADATRGGHVWMTTDAGLNWQDITGNLPNIPTWSIQVDTSTSATPILYVGTDVGVFVSANQGATWFKYGAGLPNVQVRGMDLVQNAPGSPQNVLYVATMGRGAWQILPFVPTPGNNPAKPVNPLDPRTVGFGIVAVGAGGGGGSQVNITFGDGVKVDFYAFPASFRGGVVLALGDVTGDGFPDFVAGAGPGGSPQVNIYNGRTLHDTQSATASRVVQFFAFPATFSGGVFIAVGNVSHSAFADVVVGAGPGGGPQVNLYSGKALSQGQAQPLMSFFAWPLGSFSGGVTVAIADINGDGFADVIVGAGPGALPEVKVFDGKAMLKGQLTLLADYLALPASFRGGVFVAAGDLLTHGGRQIVVGAGAGARPEVEVFDSANLVNPQPTAAFLAYPASFTGGVRVSLGKREVNGSLHRAILTGAGPGGSPEVALFDGITNQLLDQFFEFPANFTGGVYPSGGGI